MSMIMGATGCAVAAGLVPTIICPAPAATLEEFNFHHDGIIGTSLDLLLLTRSAEQASCCRAVVLGEIERLRRILSIYDPASEISRVNRGGRPNSIELRELFDVYSRWENRTGGLISCRLGGAIARAKSRPGTGELNVDALGKAYVIERAAAVAAALAPAGILNIGGDLRAWGERSWRIGIADPHHPADNAPLAGFVEVRNAAVAASGSYARGPHIIDPRTQSPSSALAGATIVAADCITANALATAACAVGEVALRWSDDSVLGWMLVDDAGRRSVGGIVREHPPVGLADQPSLWPKDFEVSIQLVIRQQQGRKTHRPYVCVWVEDAKGKVVRNLAVWGNERKYLRDMSVWWKATGGDNDLIRSVARASRQPGRYALVWDGKDDKGTPLPKGDYTIRLEVNREKGRHVTESVKLSCRDEQQSATIRATPESEESAVDYGPRSRK